MSAPSPTATDPTTDPTTDPATGPTPTEPAAAPSWVAAFYDAKARAHGPSGVLEHHVERAEAIARFGRCPRGRVLELGAGSGGSAAATADLGYDVTAVEVSPVRAGHARELAGSRSRLEVVEADFLAWPGAEEPFDAVVMWDGFGVGGDEEQRVLLRRIAGWLRPTGVAVLDVFHAAGWVRAAGHDEVDEDTGVRQRLGYDHVGGRFVDSWWLLGDHRPPLTQTARCYTVADLLLLLDGTGLRLAAVELDGEPVDLVSGEANQERWADASSYRVRLVRTDAPDAVLAPPDPAADEVEPAGAVEVSFAGVAAEDPVESLQHEAEATDLVDATAVEPPGTEPVPVDPDAIPVVPTPASLLGPGPVHEGDDVAP